MKAEKQGRSWKGIWGKSKGCCPVSHPRSVLCPFMSRCGLWEGDPFVLHHLDCPARMFPSGFSQEEAKAGELKVRRKRGIVFLPSPSLLGGLVSSGSPVPYACKSFLAVHCSLLHGTESTISSPALSALGAARPTQRCLSLAAPASLFGPLTV